MDAGSADGGFDAGLVLADAGLPPLVELPFALAATQLDGGLTVLVPTEGRAELDPARGFDLDIPVLLKDYRVRIMDWRDEVVSSDEKATVSDAGVSYRIDLVQPLKAGRTYHLLVDAQFGSELSDFAGRSWDDLHVALSVRGDVDSEPGKAPKPKKRR